MALGTMLHQQRSHLRLEEFEIFGPGLRAFAAYHRLGPDDVGHGMPDDQERQTGRCHGPRLEGVNRTTFGRA